MARGKVGPDSAATLCGAVVVAVMVTLEAEAPSVICTVVLVFVPLVRLQPASLAVESGVQLSDTVPVNPPLGETEMVVEPDCPGLVTATGPAAVRLTGPFTMRYSGAGTVADV